MEGIGRERVKMMAMRRVREMIRERCKRNKKIGIDSDKDGEGVGKKGSEGDEGEMNEGEWGH